MFNQNPNDPNRYEAQPRGYDPAGYGWNPAAARPVATVHEGFLTASFVWMFLALLVSAATAGLTLTSARASETVYSLFPILIIAELGLVFGLSMAINRLNATVAVAMLFVYAALTGATLSIIAYAYSTESIVSAFVGASAIYAAAAAYGAVTGRDLTSLGGILFVGVIGLLVAMLVNLFVGGSTFGMIIGVVGVLLFTGLTAYDVQRIRNGRMAWIASRENASVMGALALYLDFVNLFLMLLRVMGAGSRR